MHVSCTRMHQEAPSLHNDAPGCTCLTRGPTRTPRTHAKMHPAHTAPHDTQSLHEDAPRPPVPTVGHAGAHVPCTRTRWDAWLLHEGPQGHPGLAPGYAATPGALARGHSQLTPPTPLLHTRYNQETPQLPPLPLPHLKGHTPQFLPMTPPGSAHHSPLPLKTPPWVRS